MTSASAAVTTGNRVALTVLVSALGYFVDVYDLVLFSIYRPQSLSDLGVPLVEQLQVGMSLMNAQMAGLIVGGVVWGMLADKRGRTSVLFGSILVYSIANIGNAFVHGVASYFAFRFLAGFGLAGEIGAAVTLISEVLSRDKREYGSSALFGIGLFGAIAACLVSKYLSWRTGYIVGGVMGLSLLVMRATLAESAMFNSVAEGNVRRGSLTTLFAAGRWKRFVAGVLIGVPTYFGAIISAYIPEFAKAAGTHGALSAADGIMYGYIGVFFGSVSACMLSRRLASRKKAMLAFILINLSANLTFFLVPGLPAGAVCMLLVIGGFGSGYVALYITTAAEMFGTNLRATAATMVPSFVRASTIPMTLVLQLAIPVVGLVNGALLVQATVVSLAFGALFVVQETFGKDLDYVEA